MDKRIFFLISKARHNLHKRMERIMEAAIGVPVTQVVALLALESRDGSQLKGLGRFLGLNKSGVTGLVKRMEDNRLVRKQPDALDGRATRVFMTAKGKRVLQQAKPIIKIQNTELVRGFSDSEIAVVLRFLNHLCDNGELEPAN
ncbi:MarR family winged helix-turn-helix transcriptional regulator [Exilibacterium tricleocarpae]|nr:MarR family winged helix-turn-helix transcriptional regulator [Exilibacterium tricleocarpae]